MTKNGTFLHLYNRKISQNCFLIKYFFSWKNVSNCKYCVSLKINITNFAPLKYFMISFVSEITYKRAI